MKSNAELIAEARNGNQAAFATLYERHAVGLQEYVAIRYFRDGQDWSDDVVQQTFVNIHRKLDRFDPTKDFVPWMRQIAHRAAIDTIRVQTKRRAVSIQTDDGGLLPIS